jgi:hypothetical protein
VSNLEDLLVEFDEMGFEPTTLCESPQEEVKSFRNRLQQALTELQAIKEANPSEALECLHKVASKVELADCDDYWEVRNAYAKVEQALLKAEKLEKALEIIKNKDVDIRVLNESDNVEMYNEISLRPHLIESEFEFIKEMLKND